MKKLTVLVMLVASLIGLKSNAQSCLTTYCSAVSLSTAFEFIRDVNIGPLSNFSGNNGGYADFGSMFPATYTAGSSYSYNVTPGYPDGPFSLSWVAWMDFNQDGDFDDPGEEIFTDFGQFMQSGGFSIPASALNGDTKLRIGVRFGSYPASCGTYPDGDFEDYCITITGGVTCNASSPVTGLSSVVSAGSVTMNWNAIPGSVGCQISGGPVPSFSSNIRRVGPSISSATLPTGPLAPGDYNWKVSCACQILPTVIASPLSAADVFTISGPVAKLDAAPSLSISPNPASGQMNVQLFAGTAGEYSLSAIDLLGRKLLETTHQLEAGQNNLSIPVNTLAAGTYLLLVEHGNMTSLQQTFIKE